MTMKISYNLQKFYEEEKANGKVSGQAVFFGIGNARNIAKKYGIIGEDIETCVIDDVLSIKEK